MECDPYYEHCCITGASAQNTKIEWHHNLIFAGKQVQEKFCILPLSEEIHRDIVYHKEKCDWIMWNRATPEEIARYSKATNYQLTKERLNNKYGKPKI